MNIEDYREYCLSVKGATECMPFDEHTLVFKVMDKMFTFATLRPKNGRFWADMKCNPDKSEELIEQYEDIFWGPFSDKKHWITVYLEGDVPCGSLSISPNTLSHNTFLKTTKSKRYKF